MFARCFYIFNRINCGTVTKLLAVGKEADFIHLINNCRHKFVKSRETSLTKKAFSGTILKVNIYFHTIMMISEALYDR